MWDKFGTYAKNSGFNPLEATSHDIVTWIIQRSQENAAPAKVQFELQAIKTWRLQAGKPMGNIPFEAFVAQGFMQILDLKENYMIFSLTNFKPC